MTQIKFGTDGWRAIIDEDFTEDNVSKVIQGFCDFQKDQKNKLIYVGYDRRHKSLQTAKLTSQILASNGFSVRLSKTYCPTPCVSLLVKNNNGLAGVVITASHNPSNWNGIKFKESYGGAASVEYTSEIEKIITANDSAGKKIKFDSFESLLDCKKIIYFDPFKDYVSHIQNFIDVKAIKNKNYKIAVDPLFGAGTDFTSSVLDMPVIQIHGEEDPNFGGLNPEPIETNLNLLKQTVIKNKADIGLSTDGDADRIGAFDEKGNFISSHQIFALLLLHNLRYRKLTGAIVKSTTTTNLIKKICKSHGVLLIETPVGFKHISKQLVKHNALMGGEESGGISIREHVHERDGVLNGLLLLEMMAVNDKSLSCLIADMDKEFGKFFVKRIDYHLTHDKIKEISQKLSEKDITEIKGVAVTLYDLMDGTKVYFSDGSWFLVRASGTEPLLRVYAEGPLDTRVNDLHKFVCRYLGIA